MSSSIDPVSDLQRAASAVGDLIAGIADDQWGAPTPCTDWTVHELVGHLVMGNQRFAAVLRGERSLAAQPADLSGTDLVTAYRDGVTALVTAFRQPGTLDRTVTVPIGTVPGIAALHLRIVETLVHGWDIAAATRQPADGLPADLAERELAFTRAQLPNLPPDRAPFAPAQPVPEEAPAIDQLAALLGRSVRDG